MKTDKNAPSRNGIKTFFLLVSLLFTLGAGKATAQSTMGKDFWMTFLAALNEHTQTLSLIFAGPRACTGTITNPNTNWSMEFTVSSGSTTNITIPMDQAYYTGSENITNTALHIVSTDTISVYASNFQPYIFDVTDVLPTSSLGSDYIMQTYPANFKGMVSSKEGEEGKGTDCAEFVIVATEDNTKVSIRPSYNTASGHLANQSFSVTLNQGQCYQVMSVGYGDFSGSQVSAEDNKKIAVFAGNYCTRVPSGCTACDHIIEQMMPVDCWGQQFVITNSMMRSNDVIRVTALNNNCQIKKNGSLMTTINARQTYEFEITSTTPSAYLETSEPAAVYLYLTGASCGGSNGDPSMVIISPIEQRISNITFSTFNSGNSQYHYVNVITDTDKKSGMRLDGNSIASQFQTVSGNSKYSYARIQVSHGSHTLSNTMGGFIGHVYGLGSYESYAYSVGSMMRNLSSQMTVSGQSISEHPTGFDICANEALEFELTLNYDFSQANWTFGNDGTGSGSPVTHTFDTPGDYPISCQVYKLDNGQNVLVSTLETVVHVHPVYDHDISETRCASYTWNGQTYTETGSYSQEFETTYGCDSLVTLHLTINPEYTTQLTHTDCDEYEWYGYTYNHSGTYQHMEQTVDGCDSLLVMELTINRSFNSEENVTTCDSYTWRGTTYTVGGNYTDLVQTPGTCDSTFVLNLTLDYQSQKDTTVVICDEFKWHGHTYTESGDYSHVNQTVHGCDSSEFLHLTITHLTPVNVNVDTCDLYHWNGVDYKTSGNYEWHGFDADGCDSTVFLSLSLNYSPQSEIHGLTQVAISTDLWPGVYNYCVADSLSVKDCDLIWHCDNPEWIIMPGANKYWCKIIAKTLGQAVLTADAVCPSGCDNSFSININASYFDTDEHSDGVKLFPNPAKSQVTVQAPQLTSLRMLDCFGQTLKDITYEKTDTVTLDLSGMAKGIYLMEIATTTGKFVKRLIIQ